MVQQSIVPIHQYSFIQSNLKQLLNTTQLTHKWSNSQIQQHHFQLKTKALSCDLRHSSVAIMGNCRQMWSMRSQMWPCRFPKLHKPWSCGWNHRDHLQSLKSFSKSSRLEHSQFGKSHPRFSRTAISVTTARFLEVPQP